MSLTALKHFLKMLYTRGPFVTAGKVYERAYIRCIEHKYGAYCETTFSTHELGFTNPDCHEYGATNWISLRRVLKKLCVQPSQEVFLDFGSGLGRAVIVASTLPFKRVIGVEYSARLHELATQNVNRARQKLACKDVVLHNEDAAIFLISDDVTCIYFFNSFHGPTLDRVLENLRNSVLRNPRELKMICKLASICASEPQLATCPWLLDRQIIPFSEGDRYWIFRVGMG